MVSTKSSPGPFDGLEKAKPDEPVFPLIGRDELAPSLVLEWVRQKREAIIKRVSDKPEKRRADLVQCREAEEIAFAMVEWRKGHSAEPEEVEETRPQAYSGYKMGADELAAKKQFDDTMAIVRLLRNGAAEIMEAHERLMAEKIMATIYLTPTAVVPLAWVIDKVNEVANAIQPKRVSYAHRAPPEPIGESLDD